MVFRFLIWITLLATTVLTVAGYFGSRDWLLDLTNHFRVQYALIQTVLLSGLFLYGTFSSIDKFTGFKGALKKLVLLASLMTLCLNMTEIGPYYLPQSAQSIQAETSNTIKVLHLNVLGPNRAFDKVIEQIKVEDPDILSLAEYNKTWEKAMQASGVLKRFLYQYSVKNGNDGLYSKLPVTNIHTQWHNFDPTTEATLSINGQPVSLLLVHPRNPSHKSWYKRQQAQFKRWEEKRLDYEENLLVIGDLNSAPWSQGLKGLIHSLGVRDSRLGFGVLPTWPTWLMNDGSRLRNLLGIPLDYVLVSPNFTVHSCRTGMTVGSDHLPLIVELSL